MPKRGVIALLLTTVALVLLLSFKTPDGSTLQLGGTALRGAGQPPAAIASAALPAAGASSAGGVGGGAVGNDTGQAISPQPSPVPSQSTGPQTGAGAQPGKSYTGQVTGSVVQTPYGAVQVQVSLQSGKITDVQALQMPADHFRSQQISQAVAPMLRSEALQAQSAQIDTVSGATYTSTAYRQSLQAALDQARA